MSSKFHECGSDNVFFDIGTPAADEHLLKATLVFKIDALLKERGMKQVEAAALFGVTRAELSKLQHGEFRQYSVERLLQFLVALGQVVDIVVKPRRSELPDALRVT